MAEPRGWVVPSWCPPKKKKIYGRNYRAKHRSRYVNHNRRYREAKREDPDYQQYIRDSAQKYRDKHRLDPEYIRKRRARDAVAYAMSTGRLARTPCEDCGEMKVEGHHKSYEAQIDVEWLCRKCHAKRHRKL